MSGRDILEIDRIDVFYGASQILFGVSFGVERGQSLALLGPNGAGKSKMMKAIIGLAPPRRGTAKVQGVEVQRRSADRIARAGIGFVPEDRQIFPEHSVEDNLLIGAKPGLDGRNDWTLKTIYDVFPMLAAMRGRMGGRL
jgi:branched-chain amino acid transport system ATP-binding protein